MDRIKDKQRALLICLLLIVLATAAFWPVLRNDFVKYDDPDYVTNNPYVLHGLSLSSIAWAFRPGYAGNWFPVTWLSHMLDVQLFGLKPAWHHLVNLLLHLGNSILLLTLLHKLTKALWPSTFVAALFALHPLHVESVAWVAERKDVLSTFFFLLTLIAYATYANRNRNSAPDVQSRGSADQVHVSHFTLHATLFYLLALLLFALGLMSKAMLVTLPFVLLLLDFWPLRRLRLENLDLSRIWHSAVLLEKLPFFALSLASSIITFIVQKNAGAVSSLEALPLEFRITNAVVSYVRYLGKTIWPANLAVFYPAPDAWPTVVVLGAAVLLMGITALSFYFAKRAAYVLVGWLWYLGTLVPVIGLVQVGQQSMADRYAYIPSIGLFIALVWTAAELISRRPTFQTFVVPFGTIALFVFAGLAFIQTRCWRDNIRLFEHALATTHDNWVAHNNLGVSVLDARDSRTAETHFAEAVRIKPNYSDALVNLGLCRARESKLDEAKTLLERALACGPTANAHYNLANLLGQQGDFPGAEVHYQTAIRKKPEFVEAYYNLGIVQAKLGKNEQAMSNYRSALQLRPAYVEARLSLGALLAGQQKWDEAIAEFDTILRTDSENADARFNLNQAFAAKSAAFKASAIASITSGKAAKIVPQLREMVRLRPDSSSHYLLALALDATGRSEEAIAHYREAVRLDPNSSLYRNDLAWLLATHPNEQIRNSQEAIALAEQACRLSGDKEPRFWGTLDAAYASAGRFEQAIKTAEKTRELALAARRDDVAKAAEERVALYRAGKPYYTASR